MVRAALLNLAFYANAAGWMVLCLPGILLPHRAVMRLVRGWALTSIWLTRHIAGIRVEIRGLERRAGGPLLIAAKHQSALETFALLPLLADPTFILKRELNWIPVFGWWSVKAGMIPVARGRGSAAMQAMAQRARKALAGGRQIIIFPEGTRRPPGAPPSYRHGAAVLYTECGVACQPVAVNTGHYWPRRSWRFRSGHAVIEFLEPIPPGLDHAAFLARLEHAIEPASDRLLAEAAGKGGHESRTSC